MEIVIVWLLFAAGVGALASARGRNFFGYFALSVLLSPLLGLIVVLVTANLTQQQAAAELQRQADERAEWDRKQEHEKQLAALKALVPPPAPPVSSTDELVALAALRDRGALTEEEFQQQKAAVLRRSS
ncbi:MAG: hypothetical protein RL375_2973 [Pseudomonadota bacterium]|jgi:cytochrome c-type biogenesis protein CcmH/NrfG